MKNHVMKLAMFVFVLSGFLFADGEPVNIIQNSSFDDSLNTWYFYKAEDSVATIELDTNSVITGKNCAHVNVIKPYKSYPSGRIMLNTPVSIYNGTKYMVSFKIRASKDIKGKGIWWCLYDNNDDPSSYFGGLYGQVIIAGDTTIAFKDSVIADVTDESAHFSIDFAAIEDDSVEIWIDDIEFSVVQVEEPGVKPEGSGTEADPYKIASLANLSWFTQATGNKVFRHYIQTVDIDAAATANWDWSDDNNDGDLFNDPNDFTEDGNNEGWLPVQGQFTSGVYDGNGHVIDNLYTNGDGNVGLFNTITKSVIKNLGITNVDFTGSEYIGALAGTVYGNEINNVYATGQITGDGSSVKRVGGLIGYIAGGDVNTKVINSYSKVDIENAGEYSGGFIGNAKGALSLYVENCFATGNVLGGTNSDGGFIGKAETSTDSSLFTIKSCYSTGDVVGGAYSGGFIGYIYAKAEGSKAVVENCYSLGDVHQIIATYSDGSPKVISGGFAGYVKKKNADDYTAIINSYSIASVTFDYDTVLTNVGFVASNKLQAEGCFFDSTASNQKSSPTAEAKTTAEMMQDSTFTNAGWDLTNVWSVDHNYPNLRSNKNDDLAPLITVNAVKPSGSGTEEDPYLIESLANLSWLTQNDSVCKTYSYYEQTEDIDASATRYWDDSDDNGDGDKYNDFNDLVGVGNNDGWLPLGTASKVGSYFSGNYDGNGKVIDGLAIVNRASFFPTGYAFIRDAQNVTVKDLGLTNIDFTGDTYGAGMVAKADTLTISGCYVTGKIYQEGSEILGGMLGRFYSGVLVLENSYTDVEITTGDILSYAAGFACYIDGGDSLSYIKRCYSLGDVNGGKESYTVGGFLAKHEVPEIPVNECYNAGDVKGGRRIGGFIAMNKKAYVADCYNLGDVTSLQDTLLTEIGPFCGYNKYSIKTSYSVGSVYFSTDTVITDHGFVGRNYVKTGKPSAILSACFFDSTVSNQKSSVLVAAKTTKEMMTESTYTDSLWNFTTVWEIDGENYPTFREISVGISEEKMADAIPTNYELNQNYPNPFNPTTTISFALPEKADVTLTVYNIIGQKVAELVNGKMAAGSHIVNFKAGNLASGVYIYRLQAGNFVSVKKMMLIK